MPTQPKTYILPASLGLALSSSRWELVELTRGEVRRGEVPVTPEFTDTLLQLVRDLLQECFEAGSKVEELTDKLEDAKERLANVGRSIW